MTKTFPCLLTAEHTSRIWKRRGPASSPGSGSTRRRKCRRRRPVSTLPTDVAARQEETNSTQVHTREVAVHWHLLTSAPRYVVIPVLVVRLWAGERYTMPLKLSDPVYTILTG